MFGNTDNPLFLLSAQCLNTDSVMKVRHICVLNT